MTLRQGGCSSGGSMGQDSLGLQALEQPSPALRFNSHVQQKKPRPFFSFPKLLLWQMPHSHFHCLLPTGMAAPSVHLQGDRQTAASSPGFPEAAEPTCPPAQRLGLS